jgi:hypothetical protein
LFFDLICGVDPRLRLAAFSLLVLTTAVANNLAEPHLAKERTQSNMSARKPLGLTLEMPAEDVPSYKVYALMRYVRVPFIGGVQRVPQLLQGRRWQVRDQFDGRRSHVRTVAVCCLWYLDLLCD